MDANKIAKDIQMMPKSRTRGVVIVDNDSNTNINANIDIDSDCKSNNIGSKKVFVFVRNQKPFPYLYALRANTNSSKDAERILNGILDETNKAIGDQCIADISTFDYDTHFDRIVHKIRKAPAFEPGFGNQGVQIVQVTHFKKKAS